MRETGFQRQLSSPFTATLKGFHVAIVLLVATVVIAVTISAPIFAAIFAAQLVGLVWVWFKVVRGLSEVSLGDQSLEIKYRRQVFSLQPGQIVSLSKVRGLRINIYRVGYVLDGIHSSFYFIPNESEAADAVGSFIKKGVEQNGSG